MNRQAGTRCMGFGVWQSKAQQGFVLIASLLLLLVVTVLGVGMFHSLTLQQQMSSNFRNKARAFQVAQVTLQYAEHVLATQGNSLSVHSGCSGGLTVPTICDNAVTINNPTSNQPATTLSSGYTYSNMVPALPVSRSGGLGNYYAYPQFYIQSLGLDPVSQDQVYRITSLAYGGTASAVAVVQSTYALGSGVRNLGVL